MVKGKQLKRTAKTYGKKKTTFKKVNPSVVINNNYTIINHIHNSYVVHICSSYDDSCNKCKKPMYHTQTSSRSEDEFDKLLKGPIYNKCSTSRPQTSGPLFTQRQDTATFYHSDVSTETSSSMQLFKDNYLDSDSSDLFSMSHIPTPPSYRLKNNKLVRVAPSVKFKNTQRYKRKRRILNSSSHLRSSLSAVSSTPSKPRLVLAESNLLDLNVSPILPPEVTIKSKLLAIEPNKGLRARDTFDMSALAAGLGKLGICSTSVQDRKEIQEKDEGCKKQLSNRAKGSPIETKTQESDNEYEADDSSLTGKKFSLSPTENVLIESIKQENDYESGAGDSSLILNKLKCPTEISSIESKKHESYNEDGSGGNIFIKGVPESPSCSKEMKNEPDEYEADDSSLMKKQVEEHSNENSSKEIKTPENNYQYKADYGDLIENKIQENPNENSLTENIKENVPKSPVNSKEYDSPVTSKDNGSRKSLRNCVENEGDNSIIKTRLSLRPGKQWKRSLLQQRLEDNRKSTFTSYLPSKRKSTIGPALLEKLVKAASKNISAPNLSHSLDDTLPILRLNAAALNTITKRRKHKAFKPLDIVQEEECSEQTFSFNQSCREDCKRSSLDLFQEEEDVDFCNDSKSVCSGVNDLPSYDLEQRSCHTQDEIASSSSTEDDEIILKKTIKLGALARCGQEYPYPFSEIFPDNILDNCKKIGEGVFGEVFMITRSTKDISVLKVIPVEGTQLVNNEPQKCLDEVLSEIIISEELSFLRNNPENSTSGFCELKDKFCLQGAYPLKLVDLWKKFAEEDESENDCPDMFDDNQLYIALELDHAGQPVETFKFESAKQALSVFLQTLFSLGTAELSLEFEHRDLHIGNVLIKNTSEEFVPFVHNGVAFQLPTYGIKATIIDFTLSRISFEDDVLFCDLEKDPDLFTAQGDYQFEIYRLMRDDLGNNWRTYVPLTNLRWLDYLADKLITKKKYKRSKSIIHKSHLKKLRRLKEIIFDFTCTSDLSVYLLESYVDTMNIIKTC